MIQKDLKVGNVKGRISVFSFEIHTHFNARSRRTDMDQGRLSTLTAAEMRFLNVEGKPITGRTRKTIEENIDTLEGK